MLRHETSRVGRARSSVIVVTVLCASFVVGTGTAGRAAAPGKVDRDAVLRYGAPINEQGGVYFDPANGIAKPARSYMDLIYDTMIRETPDKKGKAALATKWSAPDPATAEFTLREGVVFADGDPFNAQAVKAAWDRNRTSTVTPNIPDEILAISDIEVINDLEFRVHFNAPIAEKFLNETVKNAQYLGVPSPTSIAAGTVESNPVGAGPYMLESYEEGQNFTLVRNPKFYDPKSQKLAAVEFINVAPGAPSVAALQAGTVDTIWNLSPDPIETIKNTPGLVLESRPGTRVNDIVLCSTSGVFASKDARQAVQWALDRDAISEGALDGVGNPTILALTASHPGYDKSLEKTYSYKPKKAKALLKKAGVEPGTTITALVSTTPPQPAISEIVQSNLKDVGLNMEITSSTDVVGDSERQKWDMNFVLLTPTLMTNSFEADGAVPLNTCGYDNPELQAAFATANDGSKTLEEQNAAWKTLQEIFLEESPVIVTGDQPIIAARTEETKGLTMILNEWGPVLYTIYKTK